MKTICILPTGEWSELNENAAMRVVHLTNAQVARLYEVSDNTRAEIAAGGELSLLEE